MEEENHFSVFFFFFSLLLSYRMHNFIFIGKNYVVSGTLGSAALHACYYRKENEHIQVQNLL